MSCLVSSRPAECLRPLGAVPVTATVHQEDKPQRFPRSPWQSLQSQGSSALGEYGRLTLFLEGQALSLQTAWSCEAWLSQCAIGASPIVTGQAADVQTCVRRKG